MKILPPLTIAKTGTFARATTGTYVDADGVVQTASIDIPRWDYAGGVFNGLLLETERTNLTLQSEALATSPWTTTSGYTCTANATTAPDGNATADFVYPDAGSASFDSDVTRQTISNSPAVATTYTHSAFVKLVGPLCTRIRITNYGTTTADGATAIFNPSDLTVVSTSSTGTWSAGNAGIVAIGDGWYRVRFTFTTDTCASLTLRVFPYAIAGSFTGDGNSGLYIWGVQCEKAATYSSYISTTTVAVTRSADVNSAILVSSSAEDDYTAWNSGTAYVTGNTVMYNHKNYEALQNGTNKQPDLFTSGVTPYWLDLGYNNRWKMFDTVVGTRTAETDIIQVALTPGSVSAMS